MEGKVSKANLAILDSMAKMICCSGMLIERYDQAIPNFKIKDPTVKIQAYPNKKQSKIILEDM